MPPLLQTRQQAHLPEGLAQADGRGWRGRVLLEAACDVRRDDVHHSCEGGVRRHVVGDLRWGAGRSLPGPLQHNLNHTATPAHIPVGAAALVSRSEADLAVGGEARVREEEEPPASPHPPAPYLREALRVEARTHELDVCVVVRLQSARQWMGDEQRPSTGEGTPHLAFSFQPAPW